jgi:hypothetical protein
VNIDRLEQLAAEGGRDAGELALVECTEGFAGAVEVALEAQVLRKEAWTTVVGSSSGVTA